MGTTKQRRQTRAVGSSSSRLQCSAPTVASSRTHTSRPRSHWIRPSRRQALRSPSHHAPRDAKSSSTAPSQSSSRPLHVSRGHGAGGLASGRGRARSARTPRSRMAGGARRLGGGRAGCGRPDRGRRRGRRRSGSCPLHRAAGGTRGWRPPQETRSPSPVESPCVPFRSGDHATPGAMGAKWGLRPAAARLPNDGVIVVGRTGARARLTLRGA